MPIKFVPREIVVEFRQLVLKYSFWPSIPLFTAIALGNYAVYAWIEGNPGNTIFFGLMSFGFTVLSKLFSAIQMAHHEIALKHAPDKVKFWSDVEAYESNFKSMDDLVREHGSEFLRLNKIWDTYVRSLQTKRPPDNPTEDTTRTGHHPGFEQQGERTNRQ